MKTRFKKGDVIKIVEYWDSNEKIRYNGLILIESVEIYSDNGGFCYSMKKIKGNTNWTAYNHKFFDEIEHCYLLGNIYDDPAFGVLYGPKE